jgi:DNA-binding CsgD family transcriptional regulator
MLDLIKNYTIKYDRKIKKVCNPLKHLNIPTFAYYSIEEDGRFAIISNYPKQLEFFYGEKLYMTCPYLTAPHLFRSGAALIPLTSDPEYQQKSRLLHRVNNLFLIVRKLGRNLEGFFFITEDLDHTGLTQFLNHYPLLCQFGTFFKRELQQLIGRAKDEGYNLRSAKGEAFLTRDPHLPLSGKDPNASVFAKTIAALSPQEQCCLELFQEGRSAQATAALLGLKKRTVEHYFENIKQKLGCQSKWELLGW